MSRYVLIQSKSPWESGGVGELHSLARDLAASGNEVTLYLVQNGVLGTRAGAKDPGLEELLRSDVRVLADDFSLRERAIDASAVKPGVSPSPIDAVVDLLATGAKALWH